MYGRISLTIMHVTSHFFFVFFSYIYIPDNMYLSGSGVLAGYYDLNLAESAWH